MPTRLRTLLILLLVLPLVALLLYLAVACALMFWPATRNDGDAKGAAGVEAWVLSNGIHTDLVFPLRGPGIDWTQHFAPSDLRQRAAPPNAQFIAIGWGDHDIYLHTPHWADLTAGRALRAALGRNGALLHVTYLRRADLGGRAYRLALSAAQYQALQAHVLASMPQGRAVPVPGAHYADNDAFYAALGSPNIFRTCNSWTGEGLRRAGVTASRWTPFDFNVTWHLESGRP